MSGQSTDRPDWQIAVYAAVENAIPSAPFVAYPLIPMAGKDGKRGVLPAVRCSGRTITEAKAAAQAWIDAEVEKNRAKAENIKAGAEKRRAQRVEAE